MHFVKFLLHFYTSILVQKGLKICNAKKEGFKFYPKNGLMNTLKVCLKNCKYCFKIVGLFIVNDFNYFLISYFFTSWGENDFDQEKQKSFPSQTPMSIKIPSLFSFN